MLRLATTYNEQQFQFLRRNDFSLVPAATTIALVSKNEVRRFSMEFQFGQSINLINIPYAQLLRTLYRRRHLTSPSIARACRIASLSAVTIL